MAFRPIYGTAQRDRLATQLGQAQGVADALRLQNQQQQQQFQNEMQQQQVQFAQEKYKGVQNRAEKAFGYRKQQDAINTQRQQQQFDQQQQMANARLQQADTRINNQLAKDTVNATLMQQDLALKKENQVRTAQYRKDVLSQRGFTSETKLTSKEKIAANKLNAKRDLADLKKKYLNEKMFKSFGLKSADLERKINNFNSTHQLKQRKQYQSEKQYQSALAFKKEKFKKQFGMTEKEFNLKKGKIDNEYKLKKEKLKLQQDKFNIKNKIAINPGHEEMIRRATKVVTSGQPDGNLSVEAATFFLESARKEQPAAKKKSFAELQKLILAQKVAETGVPQEGMSPELARAYLAQQGEFIPNTLEPIPGMGYWDTAKRAANIFLPVYGLYKTSRALYGGNTPAQTNIMRQDLFSTKEQRLAKARNDIKKQFNRQGLGRR